MARKNKSNRHIDERLAEALKNPRSKRGVSPKSINNARIIREKNLRMDTASMSSTSRRYKTKPKVKKLPTHIKSPVIKPLSLSPQHEMKLLMETPSHTPGNCYIDPNVPSWFDKKDEVDVSVIVPLYKSREVIKEQIAGWRLDSGINVEIIYVDDNCPNKSREEVALSWQNRVKEVSHIGVGKIIVKTKNSGFGHSCNLGASFAKGKYLIFLNSDTTVTSNWIKPIVELLKDKDIGIVGNLQIKDGGTWHGTIDGAGSEWLWQGMAFVHIGRHCYNGQNIPKPFKLEDAPKDILQVSEREMVTGCCFGIRKEVFDAIGGFDLNYRVGYWEDADICLTVKEAGYKVYFTPESKIFHKLGHSNSSLHPFHDFNRSYFMNKWVASNRIDPLIKSSRATLPPVTEILIKRNGANGDVLLASAIAPALKKKYPNSKITFATQCPDVLKANSYIDKVASLIDTNLERKYSLYYNLDLAYENRPTMGILQAYAMQVGVPLKDCAFNFTTEAYPDNLPSRYVVIHAGQTAWVGRNWGVDKFNQLACQIQKLKIPVVCVGTRGDGSIACDLDLRAKTNLHQLGDVINRSELFIGIDSLPFHISQALNKKAVCFFGSILPQTRVINSNVIPVMASNLDCLGCHHRQLMPCTVTAHCKEGNLTCEKNVNVDDMLRAVCQQLGKFVYG